MAQHDAAFILPLVGALAPLALVACGDVGAGTVAIVDAGSAQDASTTSAPIDAAPAVDAVRDAWNPAPPVSLDDCSEAAKLVYVIDSDGTFSSFAPDSLSFREIGKVKCAPTGSPFSMSVDRSGVGWVVYDSGAMFNVSTTDGQCTPLARPAGDQGFTKFGMGFVASMGAGSADELFIAGERPFNLNFDFATYLGRIDTRTLATSRVGALAGQVPELTGTGDGKLWAFYAQSSPPSLAQLDLATGAPLETHVLSSIDSAGAQAWAFAFWGGDIWLFLAPIGGDSTTVWRVDGKTFAQTPVLPSTGRFIVGAGVSTCAPLVLR
ncbi:MAG: hypothetical protein RL385_3151 [Pseudomonadota bacterium]|jgi:hypothetical protein